MEHKILRTKMRVDPHDQWFIYAWVLIGGRKLYVEFKVDTGCNSLVLSHKTLKKFGVNIAELARLPSITGIQASGDIHDYKKLGTISLFHNKTLHICDTEAVCHATRETHDLLGTKVFMKFCGLAFNLADERHMELKYV